MWVLGYRLQGYRDIYWVKGLGYRVQDVGLRVSLLELEGLE